MIRDRELHHILTFEELQEENIDTFRDDCFRWELSNRNNLLEPDVNILFLFQGVHESRGVNDDYLKLESLVQKVVLPYLGTHGLYSGDGAEDQCCVLGETAWASV